MSSPEIIPSLPPPLPTHSRSLSYSSSSSSAGSPAQKSSPFAAPSLSNKRVPSPSLARSNSRAFGSSSSLSSSSPPLSRNSSVTRRTGASPTQRSPVQARRVASTSDSPDPAASSRNRALLNKVSPSLSHSRYASAPGNTSSVGLRSNTSLSSTSKTRREPLGLGLGIGGAFARGLGQLPSPPHTASDGASNASNTVRSREGVEAEIGGAVTNEGRPERPPKSEARLSLLTPPKKRTLPLSDTALLDSSAPSTSRSADRLPASISAADLGRSGSSPLSQSDSQEFPDPSSPSRPTSRLINLNSSAGSESDASARTAKEEGDVKGKARAREASLASLECTSDGLEHRKEARRSRAEELKLKNQRILDSINSNIPAQSQNGDDPSILTHRASTSTLRSPTTTNLVSSPTALTHSRESSREHASPLDRTLRSSPSVDEFGASLDGGGIRRSTTLGGIAARDGDSRDFDRRTRTVGMTPRRGQGADDLPERSYTSMSTYSPGGGAFPRRSELVGSERTRAVSSFGDTTGRDREIAEGIRRMASRDMVSSAGLANSSPRIRRRTSEAGLLNQAQRAELPDSPALANTTSPSTRQRPALPREFLDSNSPSLSARRSPLLDPTGISPRTTSSPRLSSPSLRERVNSPRLYASRTASPLATPDPDRPSTSAERRWQSQSEGLSAYSDSSAYSSPGLPLSRPPRVDRGGKGSGDSGSAGSGISSPARQQQWREGAISEEEGAGSNAVARLEARRRSRTEEGDVFRNTLDTRFDSPKERRSSAEVGSEAWMAEFQDLRRRTAQSRTGSSGGANSVVEVAPAGRIERDRTVRALNALANGDESPLSPTGFSNNSSPQKRDSSQFARPRRTSFVEPSNAINRSESARLAAASRMSTHRTGGDHQSLLFSAFERFEQYFSTLDGHDSPTAEPAELIKRMTALVGSTTKLNSGLRSLLGATTDAQIEADLDEDSRTSTISIAQFEKGVHSLLRTSDDQVRSLTEDLIAFTRLERERDRLRQVGDLGNRPASRASNYRAGAGPSPRRPSAASPFEGSTSTFTSSASQGRLPPSASRQALRDPMVEDLEPRRHTMSVSSSRSRYGTESPTPASGRRDSGQLKSPLSAMDGFNTSRRQSISSGSQYSTADEAQTTPARSELGLPTSASTGRESLRRAKGSSTSTATARPITPPHLRFPTSSSSSNVAAIDHTPATSYSSPTRQRAQSQSQSIPFPPRRNSADLSSGASSSPEEIRAQRRMEVEAILRRTSRVEGRD